VKDNACTNRDLFTDFGFELKEVKVIMAMGEVLYVFTESGFGLESVKIHIDPPLTSLPSSILDLLKPPKWTIC